MSYDPAVLRLSAALDKAKIGSSSEPVRNSSRSTGRPHPRLRAAGLGVAAACAVIGFYLGLITLTSDWFNARALFTEYGWWILALALGLGVQVSLFTYMRSAAVAAGMGGAASSVAASGGMSGVAMALCCSHYLAAVLPAIGLPFLSGAVAGLAEHQTLFFFLGVLSNVLGVAYLLWVMRRSGIGKRRNLLPQRNVSHESGKEAVQ